MQNFLYVVTSIYSECKIIEKPALRFDILLILLLRQLGRSYNVKYNIFVNVARFVAFASMLNKLDSLIYVGFMTFTSR